MSMQLRAVIPILSLLLIAGCGGGGGPAAPSTVTIGGTVTGLVGKLVLQNNAGVRHTRHAIEAKREPPER